MCCRNPELIRASLKTMAPGNIVTTKNSNVDIENIYIIDGDGERCNIPVFDNDYMISFDMRLEVDVRDYSYGITIKDPAETTVSNALLQVAGKSLRLIEADS